MITIAKLFLGLFHMQNPKIDSPIEVTNYNYNMKVISIFYEEWILLVLSIMSRPSGSWGLRPQPQIPAINKTTN